ncbi:MAG: LysR family transcriptional regulator [Ardenticatenaceae bacterium]|nr:LysR family transcriptional regulator [Ardenticatenaceae bacterium]
MELRQLEAFLTVVREGSFTQAAEILNLTQPSLSARIQQLEQSLGCELFRRDKRPIQLTPPGETFADYVERALGILNAGYDALQARRLGLTGRITVCSPFSIATYLLPQVVSRFTQAFPEADLYLETGHSDFAFRQLRDGLVDLAFAAAFPRILAQSQALLRLHDKMIVAARPAHELANAPGIPLERLWDYQLLVIHWGQAFDSYLASLQQVSHVKRPLIRVPLPAALPMAQQQPHTVTFLPRRLALVSGLVQLDVPDFQFDWDVVLMTRIGRELTELEQGFVELVTAVWHTSQP